MSLEKNFQSESAAFLHVFWALFAVLIGVSEAVGCCFNVTFYVGVRDV